MDKYRFLAPRTAEEYESLRDNIAQNGVLVPIIVDESGSIIDGHHRHKICEELGITDYPRTILAGLNENEKRKVALELNLHRRHLTTEQKRDLIKQYLVETPDKSDRQIAANLGIDHKTVGAQRKILEATGEIPPFDSDRRCGRTQ